MYRSKYNSKEKKSQEIIKKSKPRVLFVFFCSGYRNNIPVYNLHAHCPVNKLYETNNNQKIKEEDEEKEEGERFQSPHTPHLKKIKHKKEIDIETNESFLDTGRLHVYLQSNSKYIYLFTSSYNTNVRVAAHTASEEYCPRMSIIIIIV